MAKYFSISSGLRGAYLPDNCFVMKCTTRWQLKSAITYDANHMHEAYGFGGSKRDIATFVAQCWREAKKPQPAILPYCLSFGSKPKERPYGLFVSVVSRKEYLEYLKEEN